MTQPEQNRFIRLMITMKVIHITDCQLCMKLQALTCELGRAAGAGFLSSDVLISEIPFLSLFCPTSCIDYFIICITLWPVCLWNGKVVYLGLIHQCDTWGGRRKRVQRDYENVWLEFLFYTQSLEPAGPET